MAEERKHEAKAKKPWPTKAALSKIKHFYIDTEGRRYYHANAKDEWVALQLEDHGKAALPFWCRLPAKTTLGGMPEESTDIQFVAHNRMQVLACSTVTGRKDRGTGFVILKPIV